MWLSGSIVQLNSGLPPLHLICHIAVLFVLTVFDPAWPLSIDGATENKDGCLGLSYLDVPILLQYLTVFVSAKMRFRVW